jgi:glycine oxidase
MKRVVIVGAGVVGLFCAVRLARGGARVTLLDSRGEHLSVYGSTASAAAAGMLAAVGEEPAPHDAVALQSFRLWQEQRPGAEWADGVRFDGAVVVSADAAAVSEMLARAKALGGGEALSSAQAKKLTGLRTELSHATFLAADGVADPLRVMSGLQMQARAVGALVEYKADVARVSPHAVTTHDDRVFEADHVLMAPGAWATDHLMRDVPLLARIEPGKGHLVAIEIDAPPAPNLRFPGFYIARQREGVVLGSTMELGRNDAHVNKSQVKELVEKAEAKLPGEIRPTGRAWAGVRPMSPDGWPLIGPTKAGVMLAAGHSRNGWLMAPVTAEIIAAYVFGFDIPTEWAALSPARFEAS